MSDRFLEWRGHRIHSQSWGDGEPILLINGLGANTDMWAPFAAELGQRQVLSFDAPGAGRSSTPSYPVTIPMLAELAAEVLDAYGIDAADVLGYSYGGAVAQQIAYQSPDRVRQLVLAATNCGVGAKLGSARAMNVLATPFRYYSPTYFDRIAAPAYGGRTGRNEKVRRKMMTNRKKYPPSNLGYTMQLLGGATWSSSGFLDEILHSTLVISGDDDPLIPVENAYMLAERLPNATLELVERAGHLFLWDDAANVAQRIVAFLDREEVLAL